MKLRWFIVIGIASAATGAVLFLPAQLAEPMLNRKLANQASVQITGGTLWSGNTLLVIGGANNRRDKSAEVPLTWSFAPMSLLRLRAGFDVTANGASLRGRTRVEAGVLNVQLRDIDVRFNLALINRLNANVGILKPSGEAHFTSPESALRINYGPPNDMDGSLAVKVDNVRVAAFAGLPLSVPIGSYAGSLKFDKQRINYNIDKSSGLLGLTGGGHIEFGSKREFRYQGFASALPGSPVWLAGTLGNLGRASPDGRVSIDQNINW
jgi:hypothetical protein